MQIIRRVSPLSSLSRTRASASHVCGVNRPTKIEYLMNKLPNENNLCIIYSLFCFYECATIPSHILNALWRMLIRFAFGRCWTTFGPGRTLRVNVATKCRHSLVLLTTSVDLAVLFSRSTNKFDEFKSQSDWKASFFVHTRTLHAFWNKYIIVSVSIESLTCMHSVHM